MLVLFVPMPLNNFPSMRLYENSRKKKSISKSIDTKRYQKFNTFIMGNICNR
jgi:hypothetical protein